MLLLPGFMADEGTLIALKLFLRSRGYDGADLGLRAQRRLQQPARHGAGAEDPLPAPQERPQGEPGRLEPGRRVRAVRRAPGAGVRALASITLGSPVSVDPEGSQSPPLVKALYRLIAHPMGPAAHVMQPRAKKLRERKALPVPMILPLFAQRRRRAAAGGDDRRRPGAAREHPRAGQPPRAGLQRRSCCGSSPTGWRSPKAGGGRSSRQGLAGALYRLLTHRGRAPTRLCRRLSPRRRPRARAAPGTPGSCRARTARRPRDRASARGTRSAR
ncbi:MAG: hypothetical protein MZW92_00065 [Comamonadaceae bacterium]|nr:hypothetical protein [Comamonadaceae bacterium]